MLSHSYKSPILSTLNSNINGMHPLTLTSFIYQLYSIMLLQLQHEHKPKQEAIASPKLQQIASSRVTNKKQQVPKQQPSIFFNPQFYHETSSFNFHIDGLQELLKLSVGELPPFIINTIQQRKKFSEERVYQAIVQTSNDFVGIHMREFKQGMKLEMHSMFQTIHNAVEAGIWDGRYEIDESRNKYFSMAKKEKELLSHITGELVKRNLDQFKQQLDQDQLGTSQLMQISSSYHAKSQNYKTKKAQSFIKKIQEEQNRHRYSISQLIEERKIKEVQTQQERRAQEDKRQNEKRELMRKRIERQNQILALQKQRRRKIHSQYLKMVSSNRKHTFQQMEQRYNKSMMEQQKRKYKVLKDLKEEKRPINFEQIQQHMARYQELRQQNQSFRQQKRQLKESEQQIIASKKPYRSKFYSLAVKQQVKTDDDFRTAVIKRQEEYSDHVKRNFMPRTDQKKHQQLQQLIQRINNQKNNTYHSRKYMEQGKRNLQKLHLLIGQLRAKNKLKENISVQSIMQSKQPPKKYKNYLQEIKQSKIKDSKQQTIDFQDKMAKKDHEEIHMISKQKEEKARQKQHYLNNSIENIDIHTHMKGNNVVQQNYIEAAKAKMALLKKYQFDDLAQPHNQST